VISPLQPDSRRRLACTARPGLLAVAALAAAAAFAPISHAQTTVAEAALASGPAASISRIASDAETLHVTVGHSFFLDTKTRLRRVYIADPTVLDSITLSPNQIIVTAMAPGITSLILLDEAGQAQSYVVSSDVNVDGLRTAMAHSAAGAGISVEGSAGRVILSGKVSSDVLSDAAVKLANLYTKDVANALTVAPSHAKQVRLKVRILEVDRSKLAQFGINLFNPGGNTSFLATASTSQFSSTSAFTSGSGNLPTGSLTTSNALNFLLYSSKLNLGATVQDLESKQVLQILAEPTITTISGVKADFLSGGEFPFPVIQPGGSGSTSSVTIQFRPYGVKVEFTPIVNDDGTIRLTVAPEVSALDYTNAVTISGYTIPALSTRRAQTEVELRSDQSFAISGLLDQRTTDMLSKTPGAANIPIIGALFKSKNINHSTTELIVIVTPTLVDPLTEDAEPAEPQVPVQPLQTVPFDNSLGKHHNPDPIAPPTKPGIPFSGNTAAPALPSNAPAAPALASSAVPALVAAPAPVDASMAGIPAPLAPAPAPSSAPSPVAAVSTPPAPHYAPAPPVAAAAHGTSIAPAARSTAALALVDAPSAIPVPPAHDSARSAQPHDLVHSEAASSVRSLAAVTTSAATRSMVQIMALSNNQDADAMVAALKRHGYSVAVTRDPQDSLLHLEVGPFNSKTDAEAMRQRLLLEGYNASVK